VNRKLSLEGELKRTGSSIFAEGNSKKGELNEGELKKSKNSKKGCEPKTNDARVDAADHLQGRLADERGAG